MIFWIGPFSDFVPNLCTWNTDIAAGWLPRCTYWFFTKSRTRTCFFPGIRGQGLKFHPYWMCIAVPPGYGKACSQSTTYNGLKNEKSFILYEWFASVKFLDSPASIIHRNELNHVSFAVEAAKLLDTNLSMAFGWHTSLFSNELIFFSFVWKQTLFVLAWWVWFEIAQMNCPDFHAYFDLPILSQSLTNQAT